LPRQAFGPGVVYFYAIVDIEMIRRVLAGYIQASVLIPRTSQLRQDWIQFHELWDGACNANYIMHV
jgi:hypothetical protein